MKKLALIVSFVCASLFSMAQVKTSADTTAAKPVHKEKVKQVQNAAAWACPKCYMITKEGGQCTMDQTDKVQLGTYYCEHCIKGTGTKPGKCPACSATTVQMTRKQCAKYQHMPAKKAA
jgi:rubrerythrin